jgi:hypothetical protein
MPSPPTLHIEIKGDEAIALQVSNLMTVLLSLPLTATS